MATVIDPLLKGFRGRIGDLIYRTRGNKTFVYAAPLPRKEKPETTARLQNHRSLFKDAVVYAQSALKDPALHERYKAVTKNGQTAFNIAVRDFYSPPEINEIETRRYLGKTGDIITIKASDDFEVSTVMVSIQSAGGKLLEMGEAIPAIKKYKWCYHISRPNKAVPGTIIVVEAKDHPGNSTTRQVKIQ